MTPLRLMLIDDHEEFLEATGRFLGANPAFEVVGLFVSAREALAELSSIQPDLVLVDLSMPEMSGLEVTRRIKARPEPPKVMVITIHDNDEYRAAAHSVGADGFIVKSEIEQGIVAMMEV